MGLGDFGAIFYGTEKPDPTAARLCTKTTSFQFGACDRQGSHGQCSRLGVCRRKSLSEKSPRPMSRRASDDTHHKRAENRYKSPALNFLQTGLQFSRQLFVARLAQQTKHVALVCFNTWLVKWVNAVQVT